MGDDKKNPIGKVRLDGDDILPSELLIEEGEEQKTVERQTDSQEEKVRLDLEGVLEEEIPQELEVPVQVHAAAEEKKESEPEQVPKPVSRLSFIDLSLLKRLPFTKIALIGGGILALVAAGWFVVSLLFRSEPDTTEEGAGKEEQTELVQESESGEEAPDSSEIELEPFVIPVRSGDQGFVRLSVLLRTTKDAAAAIDRERQRLRLAIYNVLLNTPVETISVEEKQEAVCQELKKLLNTVLGKEYVLGVKFIRVLVV